MFTDTEDQIEREAERRFDELDSLYLCSAMTREEYDRRSAAIDAWADRQYRIMNAGHAIIAACEEHVL